MQTLQVARKRIHAADVGVEQVHRLETFLLTRAALR